MTDLLYQTGALFRAPGGNVEHPENQESVIRWGALNIGGEVDRDPTRWDTQRRIYQGRISAFPWLHCHTYTDVDYLIATGKAWVAPALGLNIEDVGGDHLDLDHIAQQLRGWPGQVLVISLAWLQNSPHWAALAAHTFALEIFRLDPQDPEAKQPQQCIDHAFNLIGPQAKVTLMYETKAPNQPVQYDMTICHSFFTGDDIGITASDWQRWQYTGPTHPAQPTPKPPPVNGDTMTLTPTQKKNVRAAIADYCQRAETNRLKWHYTQQRPFTGYGVPPEDLHAADCSSYLALAYDWAAHRAGVLLHSPLNERAGWGWTGTEYAYLHTHPAPPDKYLVGDMAIFGTASNTVHTSICRKAGTSRTAIFSSNGHEGWTFATDAPEPITLEHEKAQQHLVGIYRHPQLL